jgi:signal transduction histidine kinase
MTTARATPPSAHSFWELKSQYETVFSIFLLVLAFLCRRDSSIVYPDIVYVFVAFLGFNFLFDRYLKQRVQASPLAYSPIFVNGILITWALRFSGGPSSYLWVMYLLPIFTACLLYDRRGVFLSTGYMLALYTSVYGDELWDLDAGEWLQFFGKTSLLVLSAAVTARLAVSERALRASVSAQRRDYEDSLGRLLTNASKGEEPGTSLKALAIHEANSALAIILGSFQLLQMQLPGDVAKEEDLRRIDSSVRLGKFLMQNLAILGDSEAERPRQPVSLHGLIEEGLEECRGELRSKKIVVGTAFAASSDAALVNPQLIRQAFINFLFAAVVATPERGRIFVRTRSVAGDNNGPGFEMDIEDGGEPLGEEAKSRFFDPYGGTSGRGKGAGLGLFLAREILRRHGGEAAVSPADGGKNRLVVRLPTVPDPTGAPVRVKRAIS